MQGIAKIIMKKVNQKLRRVKSKFENENDALQSVLKNGEYQAENLKAAHTDKQFVWEEISSEETTENPNLFTVTKTPELTLQAAKQKAMDHFETIEANIKIHDQDETHIVFSKLRG